MTRWGKAFPSPSSKYSAAATAKAFVGHALGHAKAFGITAKIARRYQYLLRTGGKG